MADLPDLEAACGTTREQWDEADFEAAGELLLHFTPAEFAHLAELASHTTGWDAVFPAELLAVAT